MQVLQLSDADIAALPPGQQEQVRQLVSNIESSVHSQFNPHTDIPLPLRQTNFRSNKS
jgi:Transcription termination and cleavage factor C-terminal